MTQRRYGMGTHIPASGQMACDQRAGDVGPWSDDLAEIVELLLSDIEAPGWSNGSELDQQGAEVHFDGQRVNRRRTRHDADCNHRTQGVRRVAVEEGLQETRVGGLEGGRGDDCDLGCGDGATKVEDPLGLLVE